MLVVYLQNIQGKLDKMLSGLADDTVRSLRRKEAMRCEKIQSRLEMASMVSVQTIQAAKLLLTDLELHVELQLRSWSTNPQFEE